MQSKLLSSLNVIVKLTSAAIGKGSIGGTPPERLYDNISGTKVLKRDNNYELKQLS